MREPIIYKNAVAELSKIEDNEIAFCKSWLEKHFDLYTQTLLFYSCSTKEPKLPCFCERRKVDCLFLDLYIDLKNKIFELNYDNFVIRQNIGKKNGEYEQFIIKVKKTTHNNGYK